jgi:hypothetical protein
MAGGIAAQLPRTKARVARFDLRCKARALPLVPYLARFRRLRSLLRPRQRPEGLLPPSHVARHATALWLDCRSPGSNRRKTQQKLESRTNFERVVIVARLVFFCSALPAHITPPVLHRSSQFSRSAFFSRSFFWALLQANSCVRQLRVFCFPDSALTPCDLNHRLAISEASVGRSSACKSCKSELRQSATSDVWSIGWPEEQSLRPRERIQLLQLTEVIDQDATVSPQ